MDDKTLKPCPFCGCKMRLAPEHSGMRVDYSGMLGQSAEALQYTKHKAHAFMIEELRGHLAELGKRYYAGDIAVVDEFLQLYCIEREARQALAGLQGAKGGA